MNKKVGIGIGVGILATVGIAGGIFAWWSGNNKPAVNDGENMNLEQPVDGELNSEKNEYVGEPLPNIINRAGTIKKVKKGRVIINGPDDEDISIYIDKNTEIYGADGSEKEFEDLEVGMYITVDIDGDARDEDESEDIFDAMIIYISGK